jgi:hypothetical protein
VQIKERNFQFNVYQGGLLVSPQPIYVRLQAREEGNIVFWESIPQSFQDHVASINVTVLAVLISSNSHNFNFYRDDAENLFLAAQYSLAEGDYLSSLAWISAQTVSTNLTLPVFAPFPESYPDSVKPFLNVGRKIPVNNATIKQIAESLVGSDMTETVRNILSYLNDTQTYDQEKVRFLMNGSLTTNDILDFIDDPSISLEDGTSFCFERALLAATMLRSVGVPTRLFTEANLKTWIQVWLPETEWVDAEVLCVEPQLVFPRPLSFTVPFMVENSSDAIFPFTWTPRISMRVANLTLKDFDSFNVSDYRTVLSQPVDLEMYNANPDKLSFPITSGSKMIQAALTRNGSEITFHLSNGEKNASKAVTLGEANSITLEDTVVSFKPVMLGDIIAMTDFSVGKPWMIGISFLVLLVAGVGVALIIMIYWKRSKVKP